MYMSTCIRNKNCHQHSYGFENFMSSWGSRSKISKLQQVGDFSFFGYKSSLLVSTVSSIGGLNGLKAPYLGAFIPKLGFSASIHTHHSTYSTPNQFLKSRRYYWRKNVFFNRNITFGSFPPFFR